MARTQQSARPPLGEVSDTILRQARKSGQLNLSNRGLSEIPEKVWRLNIDTPAEMSKGVSFDNPDAGGWWEQTDLTKLIVASNSLRQIPADVSNFAALITFDVSV